MVKLLRKGDFMLMTLMNKAYIINQFKAGDVL